MYQKERLDNIMDILKKNGYVSVKHLTEELCYSNATINRDLNILEKQKLIKRSYGGAELIKQKGTPLVFRYHKMKSVKIKIAKAAAGFINDGDTVFIDGSTTAQYMAQYIQDKKNIKVITNNMALASYLSEYGVEVICLGGRIVEIPSMLGGEETVENAMKYRADKFFFAEAGVSDDGEIFGGTVYYLLHKTMAKNSKEVFFLTDSGKINRTTSRILFDLNSVTHVISDYEFNDEIKNKYKAVSFIKV